MKGAIYLDHAATTKVRREVLQATTPYLSSAFGNPSSPHDHGTRAKEALEGARVELADLLGCRPRELVMTSGGTEANCLAVLGAALANCDRGKHLITSRIEHSSVIQAFRHLEREGFHVSYLPVDRHGRIHPDSVHELVTHQLSLPMEV